MGGGRGFRLALASISIKSSDDDVFDVNHLSCFARSLATHVRLFRRTDCGITPTSAQLLIGVCSIYMCSEIARDGKAGFAETKFQEARLPEALLRCSYRDSEAVERQLQRASEY